MSAVRTVILVIAIAVALVIGVSVLGDIAAVSSDDGAATEQQSAVLLDGTGTWTQINHFSGYDETVYNSRGWGVNFTGADDSYVESTQSVELGTVGNWSVSTWARVDNGSASENMTVVAAGGDVTLQYNGSRGNWTAHYYDRSSRQTWRVDVNSPDPTGNFSLVTATANETHLTIYRNTTRGETVNITGENSVPLGNYSNFDGVVDETRTFNDTANASEVAAHHAAPIAPSDDRRRTGRIMFDQPNRSQQLFFFADADVAQSNVTFSKALPGEVMDRKSLENDINGDTDYRWDSDGPRIYVVSGGQLDGAPVAYVDFTLEKSMATFLTKSSDAIALAAILPLLLIAALVITRLRGM